MGIHLSLQTSTGGGAGNTKKVGDGEEEFLIKHSRQHAFSTGSHSSSGGQRIRQDVSRVCKYLLVPMSQ